jgi:arginine utilization protein RocB
MNRSLGSLRQRASSFARRAFGTFSIPEATPSVLGFEEFGRRAELASPGILESSRSLAALRHPDDRVQQSLAVLQALLPFAGIEGPAAVIGFAPPYYPRAEFDQEKYSGFMEILRRLVADFSEEIGKSMRIRPYFPGISDMSFLSFSDSRKQRDYVKSMSPALDPTDADEELNPVGCPVINLGPWGREYHQLGERVHMEYSFRQMPVLLSRLVARVLSGED